MWRRACVAVAIVVTAMSCRQVLGLGDPLPYGPGEDGGEKPVVTEDNAACGANLVLDPENCGRCGHSCRAGRCERGKCAPVAVMGRPDGPLFTVFDGRLFTVAQEHIVRVEADTADGGSLPPVYIFVDKSIVGTPPTALVANSAHVLWSGDQGVRVCSISGCGLDGPESLSAATRTGPIGRVADIHPTFPYLWTNMDAGTVEKYGAPPTPLATNVRVEGAACRAAFANVDGGSYLADAPGKRVTVFRADASAVAAPVDEICAIAASGNDVFYTDTSNVWRATVNPDGTLAPRVAIASNIVAPKALGTDAEYVYWAASSAETAIVRCRLGGCEGPPEVVVDALPAIESLVVEGPFIYFSVFINTTLGRVIYKVAK